MTDDINIRFIPLTQGKHAIVDTVDFERISKFKWAYSNGYARRVIRPHRTKQVVIFMHREVLYVPDGMLPDHINGNGIDNRRSNLRVCTRSQNCRNKQKIRSKTTSKYKGVYWSKTQRKWKAEIKIDRATKTRRCLGSFSSEYQAAMAYRIAALKYHKEFARF